MSDEPRIVSIDLTHLVRDALAAQARDDPHRIRIAALDSDQTATGIRIQESRPNPRASPDDSTAG